MDLDPEDGIGTALDAAEPVAPPSPEEEEAGPCPVQCVGMNNGRFWFISPSGQLRAFREDKLNQAGITGLFEEKIFWLWKRWPRFNKDGELTGWNARAALEFLVKECAKASARNGLFEPEEHVRGVGVWRGKDGGLIVHAGAVVWSGGKWAKSGRIVDDIVYPARPPVPRPDLKSPAGEKEAEALYKLLGKWNWKDTKASPILLLGWLAAAMVCGGLRWRPHIWVGGDTGTGKSYLHDLIRGILGSVMRASDPTAAGIRQLLGDAYRPVMLDEVEPGPDGRAARVQELARMASSDDQAPIARGGSDQQAVRQYIRAIFYFSSMLYPRPKPQDRNRCTYLNLAPLPPDADSEGVKAAIDEAPELGARLRARMILAWPRLLANLRIFNRVLARKAYARRNAEQLGTLLACAYTLRRDKEVEEEDASALIDALGLDQQEEAEADHDECLNVLLSSSSSSWRAGEQVTVADLIRGAAIDGEAGISARRALSMIGLAVHPRNAAWTEVRVANLHVALDRIFTGTRWAGGVWPQAMERIPGAEPRPTTSFNGVKQRAWALPRSMFDTGDPHREDPAPDPAPEPPPPQGDAWPGTGGDFDLG